MRVSAFITAMTVLLSLGVADRSHAGLITMSSPQANANGLIELEVGDTFTLIHDVSGSSSYSSTRLALTTDAIQGLGAPIAPVSATFGPAAATGWTTSTLDLAINARFAPGRRASPFASDGTYLTTTWTATATGSTAVRSSYVGGQFGFVPAVTSEEFKIVVKEPTYNRAIPEPATIALLGLGAAAAIFLARRLRRH